MKVPAARRGVEKKAYARPIHEAMCYPFSHYNLAKKLMWRDGSRWETKSPALHMLQLFRQRKSTKLQFADTKSKQSNEEDVETKGDDTCCKGVEEINDIGTPTPTPTPAANINGRQRYNLRSGRTHNKDAFKRKSSSAKKGSRKEGKKKTVLNNVVDSGDDGTMTCCHNVQPVNIDEAAAISFDDIGGLSRCVEALKEMVFIPLLYPTFFTSFHITPPKGVLLCGPPGTGKTLIARSLASVASKVAGQKVHFYMRNGADVLSKWVGEAEKHLKLLFEEAQRNQPCIIFFDEIDGLAPARSDKQEQSYNSIVSTLLALMDGLESRGQVILIGATNRVDDIDGALRRPGRFDREFYIPLPSCEGRCEILDIHTRNWKQPPSKELRLELAGSCMGYCGADLKALCTEAAMRAFREKYPQAYDIKGKACSIDADSVHVGKSHFLEAMSEIRPASHRSAKDVDSRPLSSIVSPCLKRQLKRCMDVVLDIFPFLVEAIPAPPIYRPKLLLVGDDVAALEHISLAILHQVERFPVHSLALESLLSQVSSRATPQGKMEQVFIQAKRTTPSVIYLPRLHHWWENADDQLRILLCLLVEKLPSDMPILVLGTSSIPPLQICDQLTSIFSQDFDVLHLTSLSGEDISSFLDHTIEAALQLQVQVQVADDDDDDEDESRGNCSSIPRIKEMLMERIRASSSSSSSCYGISELERLYARILGGLFRRPRPRPLTRQMILSYLFHFASQPSNLYLNMNY
ncbi:ATPase family AAA domain-containing protein At1g05910-like [Andrographis paniculata]|uniref:ATPase family AAA domain-containing protein At1g05910-like n=1 Tax=Andrographis paniculata TaxID=175694 RepID=UPI0021E8085C|nr:ATPase family AAA domain-containing protein At1g05910-like [Andrographis paniculata]